MVRKDAVEENSGYCGYQRNDGKNTDYERGSLDSSHRVRPFDSAAAPFELWEHNPEEGVAASLNHR